MSSAAPAPRITIVTPSLNQGTYLEDSLRSVLDQGYPNLEYIVMDGGSSDGSADILDRYAHRLAYVQSRPDRGHFNAINDGFSRSTGAIMGWLGADDKHFPWTLTTVAHIFCDLPEVEWISTLFPVMWDRRGLPVGCGGVPPFSRKAFFRGENLPGTGYEGVIQQESTFWRRSLWERAGGLNPGLALAAEVDLWMRFYGHADLYGVTTILAGFRRHGEQITSRHAGKYAVEAEDVYRRNGGTRSTRPGWRLRRGLYHALPARFGRTAIRLGLFPERKQISFDVERSRWAIQTVT